jgi:hypothetical protein
MAGDQGDAYWEQYGGVPVGAQFCRDTGGDSLDPEPEPEPPGTPVEQAVEFIATGVKTLAAPVLEVFKGFFAPPVKTGERSKEAALAAVADPTKKPCACQGHGGPAPGAVALLLLLIGFLAWKAFKK